MKFQIREVTGIDLLTTSTRAYLVDPDGNVFNRPPQVHITNTIKRIKAEEEE